MNEDLLKLQKEILRLPNRDNLVCILIFGSVITNKSAAHDLDIIIVCKNVNNSLISLFELLENQYRNIDFNLYSFEEIKGNISFYTREYKLEYLVKGTCVFGKNIFIDEYLKINNLQYKQSILIRSIEYLQMVRKSYFSKSTNLDHKFYFLKKYLLRILKNILLFKGVDNHNSVNKLDQNELFHKLFKLGGIKIMPKLDRINTLHDYFNLFCIVSDALIKCKIEFDSNFRCATPK